MNVMGGTPYACPVFSLNAVHFMFDSQVNLTHVLSQMNYAFCI